MAEKTIGIRISIVPDVETAPAVYQETHSVVTNQFGVAALEIGRALQ